MGRNWLIFNYGSLLMFAESTFNGDISGWDTSGVEYMGGMFADSPFNGDISGWDISSVTDMHGMFAGSSFNGDISGWDVSGVTGMYVMFAASSFNNDISNWDVSGVTDMYGMFQYSDFDGDISGWDVSGVIGMNDMFQNSSFNGDISGWDVSGVEHMSDMFNDASSFSRNLGDWYIVLDSAATGDDDTGIVGMLSAQNDDLSDQVHGYGIGSGGDSDYFEIVDGNVLKVKDAANIQEKPSYSVNVTSAGRYGMGNFRVLEVSGMG